MHGASSRRSNPDRNPEDLKRLLLRLDPDPGRAGERYEGLRRRLAKFFECNKFRLPEDLVDEVMDRVAAKLDSEEIRDVEGYSVAVARFVCLEEYKRTSRETHIEDMAGGGAALPDVKSEPAEIVDWLYQERRLACLRQCLAMLASGERNLVIQYYGAEDEKQKTFRQKLAEKAGLKLGNLRVRLNRLREQLERCVKRRLAFSK